MGAGFSKLQHGFSSTVSIMVQNTPWMVSHRFRKATVKDYPNDIRPSKLTHALAHIGGTTCELVMPLVLLFSPWPWLTWIAIISIWMLHTVHHLHHPVGGAVGVERVLHVLRRRSCSPTSAPATGTRSAT